jgi:DNA-directed RNA polymerase subunit beta'
MKNYIKINIASPQKILQWTERALPNGELIGEIKKP